MAGSAFSFPPDDLIHDAGGGVVALAIQYRLGVLGFLSSQKVHDSGALNAGLRESHHLYFDTRGTQFRGQLTNVSPFNGYNNM